MSSYFQEPKFLFLFLPYLLLLYFHWKRQPRLELFIGSSKESSPSGFPKLQAVFTKIFSYWKFLYVSIFILALATPGEKFQFLGNETSGVDIMVALDVSNSMTESYDMSPNRLEASKRILADFVKSRVDDRIGLVVFSGTAYLQSPLTSDRDAMIEVLTSITQGIVEEQGTAIGDAILLSIYRLKKGFAKSKVVLLLTDGVSNTGRVDPVTAAGLAIDEKIKIYSIGVGKEQSMFEVDFNFLEQISKESGGKFYRAIDTGQLEEVLREINSLEKEFLPKKNSQIFYSHVRDFLFWGIFLFAIELLLKLFYFRNFA